MNEYIEIGSTPCDEECAQVGADDYSVRAKKECRAYINQLTRMITAAGKEIPDGFRLVVKGNAHDFGTYHEVACKFSDDNEAACELAYWVESNAPTNWDEQAKLELASAEGGFPRLL